jgi:glycosyltransferase involved in cell wall biosynthesis
MKVLLSAYACEPGIGSEPAVGWNLAQVLAQRHQVWVLTTACHQAGLEAELAQRPLPNLRIIYFDPLGWVYDWSKPGLHLWVHLHYALWQIQAYFVAKRLQQVHGFDRLHQGTYSTYLKPSALSLLSVPLIWGPVGGGESLPPGFWAELGKRDRLYEGLRLAVRKLAEINPLVRLTIRRSQEIWASTPQTAERLEKLGARSVRVYSSVLWPPAPEMGLAAAPPSPKPLRFVTVGRLLHWKGVHLGLMAFARSGLVGAEYWIIGDGPQAMRLQTLAAQLGLGSEQVRFLGQLPQVEVLAQLQGADVLVHPSLHDSGAFVCLEAMAMGRPVICLDWGGPALQVTDDTGVKISVTDPAATIERLSAAMVALGNSAALRQTLGAGGIDRVSQHFSTEQWDLFLGSLYGDGPSLSWQASPTQQGLI